jgi:hypothetical protein
VAAALGGSNEADEADEIVPPQEKYCSVPSKMLALPGIRKLTIAS